MREVKEELEVQNAVMGGGASKLLETLLLPRGANIPKSVTCIDYTKFHYIKSLYTWEEFLEI